MPHPSLMPTGLKASSPVDSKRPCPCGDRLAIGCPGEWENGCDLGANEQFVSIVPLDLALLAATNRKPGLQAPAGLAVNGAHGVHGAPSPASAVNGLPAGFAESVAALRELLTLKRLKDSLPKLSRLRMGRARRGQQREVERREPLAWAAAHAALDVIDRRRGRMLLSATTLPDGPASASAPAPFQQRMGVWLLACFGQKIADDKAERNHRYLEESLELVQACGCTREEALHLVDYVFSRPVGDPFQEVGGATTTLAALCRAQGIDMEEAADAELARIWTMVEKIRAKQAAKPKYGPLPIEAGPASLAQAT